MLGKVKPNGALPNHYPEGDQVGKNIAKEVKGLVDRLGSALDGITTILSDRKEGESDAS